jgi:hypothetical protein
VNDPQAPQQAPSTDVTYGIERFTATDLATLRAELLQSGVDSFEAAQLVANFLSGRGYGISTDEARCVASSVDGLSGNVERLQAELERVARAA